MLLASLCRTDPGQQPSFLKAGPMDLEDCLWHQPCRQVLIGCVRSCLSLALPLEQLRRAVSGSHACCTLPPRALQWLLICSVHTWQYHWFIHEWIAKGWLSKSWTQADSSVFQQHPRQYNCSGNAHMQAFLLLPQVTNFLDLSLNQPPSWDSASTHPLSAMPSCLFFLASWGSDMWLCKVSVKNCLLTVCPCSWCTSLPTLPCSSFHWRSSILRWMGREPLPSVMPPPRLQHQREVPSISYSPSPGWWNPLPEVCLGQGSGMLRAIALAEFLGPSASLLCCLNSAGKQTVEVLSYTVFLPLVLIHEMVNCPREWKPLSKGTGKGLIDGTWWVLNFALLSLDYFSEPSKDSKGSQSVFLTFCWTLKGIFLH